MIPLIMVDSISLDFLKEYFTNKADELLPKQKLIELRDGLVINIENLGSPIGCPSTNIKGLWSVNLEDYILVKIQPKSYSYIGHCAAFCFGAPKEVMERARRTVNPEPILLHNRLSLDSFKKGE
jgi:hypothetical protein